MTQTPSTALRQAVLAVSVLDDVDLHPTDVGLVLEGSPEVLLRWTAVDAALGGHPASSPTGRVRLRTWLRQHRAVADLGDGAEEGLRTSTCAMALPADGALHPGPAWVRERCLGGALEVGLAVLDPSGEDLLPSPLWPDVAAAAGLDPEPAWTRAAAHRDRMAELAVARLQRDARLHAGLPTDIERLGAQPFVLRPVGGCDVPTLLSAAPLRAHLAREDGTGLRAVAAPVRDRGWVDPTRIDPAFVAAAWTATDLGERGFARPLLVTEDEVLQAPVRSDLGAVLTAQQ